MEDKKVVKGKRKKRIGKTDWALGVILVIGLCVVLYLLFFIWNGVDATDKSVKSAKPDATDFNINGTADDVVDTSTEMSDDADSPDTSYVTEGVTYNDLDAELVVSDPFTCDPIDVDKLYNEFKESCINSTFIPDEVPDDLSETNSYLYYYSNCVNENIKGMDDDLCDNLNIDDQNQANVHFMVKCAVLREDVSFCNLITNQQNMDDCYSEIKVDADTCNKISKASDKYECLARSSGNLTYCDSLDSNDEALSCKAEISDDASYCSQINNKAVKYDCYSEITLKLSDCDMIDNEFSKNKCLATVTNDQSYCVKAAEVSCENDAYFNLARFTSNDSYCDQIVPDDYRELIVESCKQVVGG